MTCVIAVDPGKTTGFARLHLPQMDVTTGTLSYEYVFPYMRLWAPDTLVVETFTVNSRTIRTKFFPQSLELIGQLKLYARQNACDIIMQSARDAKNAYPEDNKDLRAAWGQRRLPSTSHEKDALRHLFLWLGKESDENWF